VGAETLRAKVKSITVAIHSVSHGRWRGRAESPMMEPMTRTTTNSLATILCLLALGACGDTGPGGSSCSDETLEICQVFAIVNDERNAAGLERYDWNPDLALAAQLHAEDMNAQGYFSHDSLDGRDFVQRIDDAGYDGSARGENIARGQRSPEQVMQSWMDSDGHRRNILSEGSNEIGVGFIDNHWVQVFGFANREAEE